MQLTYGKYRSIDLAIYAGLLCVCEMLCVFAVMKWVKYQLFTVSVTGAVVAIVAMRWNYFSIIHALLGGLAYVLAVAIAGGKVLASQYAIYIIGNAFAVFAVLAFKVVPKQKIKESWLLTALFGLVVYALMQFGKTVVSLLFGGGLQTFRLFFFDDIVSLLFTVVILLIVRNLEGTFVDQKQYLLELDKEKNKIDDYNGR